MKDLIKSILNLKTILASYVGAIGYGVGYNLPNKYGLHPLICIVCCLALGMLFDKLANLLLSTEFYKASKTNKVITAVTIYLENNLGSIEKGKIANFVIMSDNVLTCSLEALRKVIVMDTIVDGEEVY